MASRYKSKLRPMFMQLCRALGVKYRLCKKSSLNPRSLAAHFKIAYHFMWWRSGARHDGALAMYHDFIPAHAAKTYDDAIKHVLFKTGFLQEAVGLDVSCTEQLLIQLELRGASIEQVKCT